MNQPKRFIVISLPPVIQEDEQGYLVSWDDYAALAAEVERLRKASFMTAVPSEQYERVIKAGDAMADTRNKPITLSEFGHLAMAWFAAKEGKNFK